MKERSTNSAAACKAIRHPSSRTKGVAVMYIINYILDYRRAKGERIADVGIKLTLLSSQQANTRLSKSGSEAP
jgi:hypothetical protein